MDIERLNRAVELLDANRLEDALREFRGLEAVTPDPAERAMVLLNQSTVLTRMGRMDDAQDRTREAAKLSPAPEVQCNALVSRASVLALAGEWKSALAEFDRVLKEYPAVLQSNEYRFLHEEVQVRRALLLVQLTRFKEAQGVLEECMSFDLSPDDRWKVLYNLGRCYFDLKEPARAKQMFHEFLQAGGDAAHVASAHFLLGTIYYNEGADGKALLEFERLLPQAGEDGVPRSLLYTWLGKTHRMLGNKTEAHRYEALARQSKQ